jgi:hypothetical protein
MEKAMDAFSKADEVGVEEDDSGIVEVRMLRASEVHELLEDSITEPPPSEAVGTPETVPPPRTEPTITPPVESTPVITPPPSPPPSTEVDHSTVKTDTPIAPKREIETPVEPDPTPSSTTQMPTAPPTEPTITPVADSTRESPIPEVDAILSKIPKYLTDPKIRDIVTDLTNFYAELKQVRVDLDQVSSHLDEEVRNHRNTAEVKRISYESLEEQLRLAKQEWTDAKKEFERADNRREKEIATRNKRIKEIEKRINKTEGAIDKRVRELQKEEEKLAKQAEMKSLDG